jgi:hypothetical protein
MNCPHCDGPAVFRIWRIPTWVAYICDDQLRCRRWREGDLWEAVAVMGWSIMVADENDWARRRPYTGADHWLCACLHCGETVTVG